MFRSPAIDKRVKAVVYKAVVLTVLLYGCEVWGLTKRLWQKLRSFHMDCVRTIGGIHMWHVQEYHISNPTILERTELRNIEVYVYRRQLRWLGHVSRMPWDRLPRKFLSSWVYSPRPTGGQVYRWGQGMEKAVSEIGLGATEWEEVRGGSR